MFLLKRPAVCFCLLFLPVTAMAAEPLDWQSRFDDDVGLWYSGGPGHTRPVAKLDRVHSGPDASAKLLSAARLGRLDELPAGKVLAALRNMQVTDGGSQHGCLRWYWEEPRPVDTNASFFTGLNLVVLRLGYADQFDDTQRKQLEPILADLHAWFSKVVAKRDYFYPNRYLGDLVCCWLLRESLDRTDEDAAELVDAMLAAADYWRDNGWGWGEHLSNSYTGVMLDEVSVLLMFGKRLPENVRRRYEQLRDELLRLEDRYDGGPRVPVLRGYYFTRSPSVGNYRRQVEDAGRHKGLGSGKLTAIRGVLADRGWHQTVPEQIDPARDLQVPCFDGAMATARIEGDLRLGSVSRFPVMPVAEHQTWGLAWQCFPVALWHASDGWGFLQWETAEGDRRRGHPAISRAEAYLNNALTSSVRPPITGQTWCLQRGGDLLVLRVMPAVAQDWTELCDRFRLIGHRGTFEVLDRRDRWSQLLLTLGKRTISVHHVALADDYYPEPVDAAEDRRDWQVRRDAQALSGRRVIVDLWAIRLDGSVDKPPVLTQIHPSPSIPRDAGERAWQLDWTWPETRWDVTIDPKATEPLKTSAAF